MAKRRGATDEEMMGLARDARNAHQRLAPAERKAADERRAKVKKAAEAAEAANKAAKKAAKKAAVKASNSMLKTLKLLRAARDMAADLEECQKYANAVRTFVPMMMSLGMVDSDADETE